MGWLLTKLRIMERNLLNIAFLFGGYSCSWPATRWAFIRDSSPQELVGAHYDYAILEENFGGHHRDACAFTRNL